MERHICKRRRIHSPQPNTVAVRDVFVRKYVSYLVPALMMINKKDISDENGVKRKVVRHQVDMALALSAQGFAWSCALKDQLHDQENNVTCSDGGTIFNSTASNIIEESNFKVGDDELVLDHHIKRKPEIEKKLEGEDDDDDRDDEIVRDRLESIRSLLPGGNEISGVDALLGELGCYIICLESQVNVLRCIMEQQQHQQELQH